MILVDRPHNWKRQPLNISPYVGNMDGYEIKICSLINLKPENCIDWILSSLSCNVHIDEEPMDGVLRRSSLKQSPLVCQHPVLSQVVFCTREARHTLISS